MQKKQVVRFTAAALIIGITTSACGPARDEIAPASMGGYEELVSVFNEFREFQTPAAIDGIPDYSLPNNAGKTP